MANGPSVCDVTEATLSHTSVKTAHANVPGTCGEWLQGWLDGEPVLVSCPIDRYSRVRAGLRSDGHLRITPRRCVKSLQAARAVLALGDYRGGLDLAVTSALPQGRGYASSTADIVAVCRATSAVLGRHLSAETIGRLACGIEPSDSLMFPGWTLFAYRSGAWHVPLGAGLRLPLVILDPGSALDTVVFNRGLDLRRIAALEPQTREALALLASGLRASDPTAIGAAARLSAMAYQSVAYSEMVAQAAGWARTLGAGGPIRAHSGSIVGLLFAAREAAVDALNWLRPRFAGKVRLARTVENEEAEA